MRTTIFASVCVLALASTARANEIDTCMKAAAASAHIKLDEVDKDACVCATKQLHLTLKNGDYDLHEKMLEVIATGADEKAFNKQMSDVMLKRGMTQPDVDAFLARSKKAEAAAQAKCNTSPLLSPAPLFPSKPR